MSEVFEHIRYDKRADGVATLTLCEPARLNAIDHGPGSMADELLRALADADGDPAVRCVLVTGEGRAFSAGGDPGDRVLESPLDWYGFLASNVEETERVRSMSKPTIGAVNGLCYGFGLILATHFDLLVAVDSARFGLIETRFGSSGAQTLPFLVGPQWAKFLALSGELITAHKAKEIGLVLEVFPPEVFEAKAQDLARRVAAMPAEAVMLNRRVINGAMTMMGWDGQRELSLALNTITNQLAAGARAADGRVLAEVRRDHGWVEYKKARDAAFVEPWLDA